MPGISFSKLAMGQGVWERGWGCLEKGQHQEGV